MKTRAYSVLDIKSEAYGTPFFMQRDQVAVRTFTDLANDNDSKVKQHPEDYTLYFIGEFDDETCKLTAVTPKILVNALNIMKTQAPADLTQMPVDTKFNHDKVGA